MRNSLHSHITYLENTIQELKNRLSSPHLGEDELLDLEMQLTMAESALAHYREAYALELTIAGSEPPGGPGAKTAGEKSAEKPNGEKNNPGKAANNARVRKRNGRPDRTVPVSRVQRIEAAAARVRSGMRTS